jgi:hypothetical protein
MTAAPWRIAMAGWLVLPALAQTGIDLAIPQSPAAAVLGLTSNVVVRPNTPREFAAALLNGFDSNGNPQNGLSLDIVPYWLAAGHLVDRKIYKANPIVRWLAGAQLSLATTKAAGSEAPPRLAAGALVRIFDKGDPRLDDTLADCLEKAAERVLSASAPLAPCPDGEDCQSEENARREALLKNTCREEARRRNWNRSGWALGAARESQSGAEAEWSSLAYGFEGVPGLENTSQFTIQWMRRDRQFVSGLRLTVGAVDTHVSLDWTAAAHSSQLALDVEKKIADNLWLEMTVGGASTNHVFLLTSFHWGFVNR